MGLGAGYPQANSPQFSRNGTLVFWSGVETHNGNVWTVRIGSDPKRITHSSDPFTSDDPCWSPDGKLIAFVSTDPIPNLALHASVWIVGADGTGRRPFLPGVHSRIAWQPVFVEHSKFWP